jgi:hypothetical protein
MLLIILHKIILYDIIYYIIIFLAMKKQSSKFDIFFYFDIAKIYLKNCLNIIISKINIFPYYFFIYIFNNINIY